MLKVAKGTVQARKNLLSDEGWVFPADDGYGGEKERDKLSWVMAERLDAVRRWYGSPL